MPSTPEQHAHVAIDRLLAAVGWQVGAVSDVNIRGARGVVMAAMLLVAVQLLLASPKPDPTPGQLIARENALATLQQIRR